MGIPYYFYLLTQTHPGILGVAPPRAGAFYLDFNGAVYNAFYERLAATGAAPSEPELCADTWAYFERLVAAAGAGAAATSISICMDGVAPVAKMVQQRKRRFMTMARDQLMAATLAAAADGAAKAAWDTNAISPGTPFMADLTAFLKEKCAKAKVAFSGPDEQGEGEHKIFAAMAAEKTSKGATIIYGLDADLIMLSLLSHTPGIYLMREKAQASLRKGAGPDADAPFVFLNVDALRAAVLHHLADRYRWAVTPAALADPFAAEGRGWIENYIALCFFLGNDFLPALPTMHIKGDGLETLLLAYDRARAAAGGHIVEGGEVSYAFVAALLHVLAPEEDGRMRAQTEEYVRRRAHATKPEERVEFYPILPENKAPVAHAILAAKGAGTWRGLYYSHLFDGAAVPEACRAYLTGLAWTLRYYKRKAKDGRWTYPHGFAPTIRDLADAAQAGLAELAGLGAAWEAAGASAAGFVSTDVQLLSILPIKSRALLPKRLQPFMTDPAFGCAHLYPRTFRLQTFMKTRLWECVPVLPPLDVAWIENAVAAAKGV